MMTQMILTMMQTCCCACGTEYPTSTTFYELDLQLAATLKEAIEKYLTEEQLSGANQYHCVTCNDKKDARRFIRLESLPETLNIQLMRFVFHRDSGQKRKLNSFIHFPEDLDMSEYVRCPPHTHLYSLVAVLSHKGPSAHSGHYIANICNSAGEWYQFSDDKVEKMQNKRIEDSGNESVKNMKRGRVPKGFLSSNTAYMLVYKKLTTEAKSGNGKKVKVKRIDSEANNCSDPVSLERLTVKDKSDSTDEWKRKNNNENLKDAIESPGTVMKIEGDCKMDLDATVISKDHEFEIKDSGKGRGEQTKEVFGRNAKLDYKQLNGAAHRAMSCGERDFYEEVEFEKWQVSTTMRDLQKEIEDQNSKRQLVIDVYDVIASTISSTEYQWIPIDWLSKWLNGQSFADGVPPIDNSILMCSHYCLDPLKVNRAKCLPASAANLLYGKYRGGPRLDQNTLCEICVKRRCKMLRFKMVLERDHKEVGDFIRNFKESNETSYIVGADSLRSWRRLAMEKFSEYMEQEIEREDHPSARFFEEQSNNFDKDNYECTKEPEEGEENETVINFNEDLLCEHSLLKTPDSSRKIVPREAWAILRKYFPTSKEYPLGTALCSICEEKMENAQRAKKDDKIKAKQQKDELIDLYYARNRNEISKCEDPERVFYIVEKGFLDSWRSFIRYAESYSRIPPSGIQNAVLLCEPHKGLLYRPSINNELYSIVTAEEWSKLTQFYEVDHTIAIKKAASDFQTQPDSCASCMLARVEQERLESLKYDKAVIYIKCIDENDDSKTENITEVAAKRPKMDSSRPSRTRRKVKGSHELKVSSAITLKDLKVMTMQICGAGPYDQHLMLGEHELTDHSQSLAALGIFPGALLTLKIDTPVEAESSVESDATNLEMTSPEKGFKGTELVPS
ncbi:hypothetical protein KPH14_003612 [Odynerus spinipes]|uniref:ubiquitinyl hydrolase 1 n=1 Tax=Odynerus spinipes TaxID=1348599 RepID=A0AAD9VKV6_9HYME|nr:hypothetical protein KPH14_003612 [Odynerus spinipes]